MTQRFFRLFLALVCTTGVGLTAAAQLAPCTPAPTASNDGPHCAGGTISLTASSSDPTATYSWTGPNNFTSSLQNPTIANATSADAGTYSVTVTVNGCVSDPGTTTVTVNNNPSSTIAAPVWVTTTSTGNTANGPVDATSCTWSITNGTITAGQTAQACTFTAGSVGTLTLTLTTTNASGCSSTSSQDVRVDAQPTIMIDGASGQPGPKGTLTPFNFRISLSNPSTQTVSVDYYTANQTAVAGKDYQSTSGTVIFQPGDTAKTVPVNVYGTSTNPQKTFLVNLTNPVHATIQTIYGWPVRGKGTILAK